MLVYDWPEKLCVSTMDWGVTYNNRAFTSHLSNAQQVVSFPGAYWTVHIELDTLVRRRAMDRELSALAGRMQGMTNAVRVPRLTRRKMQNIGSLTITASAVSGTRTLQASGFINGSLVIGDHVTINGQMFEIIEDTLVNNGTATLILNKPIRGNFSQGIPIEYMNPYCIMRFENDEFSIQERSLTSRSSLRLREAF